MRQCWEDPHSQEQGERGDIKGSKHGPQEWLGKTKPGLGAGQATGGRGAHGESQCNNTGTIFPL